MKKIIPIVCLFIIVVSACSPGQLLGPTLTPTPVPCSIQAADFIKQVDQLMPEWDDAVKLASSTSRISLTGPIATLQSLKRRGEALGVPPCAASVQSLMTSYMNNTLQAFMDFLKQEPDSVIQRDSDTAKSTQNSFMDALFALKTGE